MFNVVEKNQKLVKGIMIAIVLAFIFWGIGGYLGMGGDDGYVAKVGNTKIYPKEVEQAMEENPQQTDKLQILYGLINRQVLINNLNDNNVIATSSELQKAIANIPIFLDKNGAFNLKKYQDFLNNNYISANQFQKNVSEQVALTQLLDFFKNSYITSNLFNDKFASFLSKDREVRAYSIDPKEFYNQISITESQIRNYYQQNINKFTLPEKVKLQYLTLNSDIITNNIQISNEEINTYINNHKEELNNTQIKASHILFAVPENADNSTKENIKNQALKILAQIKANPTQFAKFAKQYSNDTASAIKGGDLGWFGKGVMVKPFEQVVFNLKPGQISNLVQTQYGYHIIKLDQIKNASSQDLTKIAINHLKKQKAVGILQKKVDDLSDIAFNQPMSLIPASKKLDLVIESTNWVSKGMKDGEFSNIKIQNAIFTEDTITKHYNSRIVDLGGNNYKVFRVIDYTPSYVESLEEVKNIVIDQLKLIQASNIAIQVGQSKLTQLAQGNLSLKFGEPQTVNLLSETPNIDGNSLKQIFSVSLNKLPAYTGSLNKDGVFTIYEILNESIDNKLVSQNKLLLKQLDKDNSMLNLFSYISYLRNKYNINYKLDRLK